MPVSQRQIDECLREAAPANSVGREELESCLAITLAAIDEQNRVLLIKDDDTWLYPTGIVNLDRSHLKDEVVRIAQEHGLALPAEAGVFPVAGFLMTCAKDVQVDVVVFVYFDQPAYPLIPADPASMAWFNLDQVIPLFMDDTSAVALISQRIKEYLTDYKNRTFSEVLLGGTFDRLHDGHRLLLETAFEVGSYVYIGLTTDEYIEKSNKHLKETIQPHNLRKRQLRMFLQEKNVLHRAIIMPLEDSFSPKALDPHLQAIIVSAETRRGAVVINDRRSALAIPELEIITIPMARDQAGERLSSTRLRIENG